jgi:hypothetical protein
MNEARALRGPPVHQTPARREYFHESLDCGMQGLRSQLRRAEVMEAAMTGVASVALILILVLAVFLSGVVLGVVAMVAVAVHRDDRFCSLAGHRGDLRYSPSDEVSRGARRLMWIGPRALIQG